MTPLEFMIYIVSPPLFAAYAYAAWLVWREEHPRSHPKKPGDEVL